MIKEILADAVLQKIHQWSSCQLKDLLLAASQPLALVACSFGRTHHKSVIEFPLTVSTEISSRSPLPLA